MELEKRWVIQPTIPEDVEQNLREYPPLLRQLLYNRHIEDKQSAHDYLYSKGALYNPFRLKNMERAVTRIKTAIHNQEPIIVYGDYDVDGITATALLVQVLRKLGARVDKHIPNRFEEGYGLTLETLAELKERGAKLIITVDCGIRSPREVAAAVEMGMQVIISDHHAPHDLIPDAYAIINPKQPEDEYPEKNLAGVGVAYKIAEALSIRMREFKVDVRDWLDFVAIGTIADIVPLTGENRSMAKAGLELLRQGKRSGLNALAGAAKLDIHKVTARDIGFVIGPRLNAAGRLESAAKAYEILATDDLTYAGLLAQELDDQNRTRQEETQRIQQEAETQIEQDAEKEFLLFAVDPAYSLGIVGLAAAKLVEKYYRPAIVGGSQECLGQEEYNYAQNGGFIRASCRSIPEFHITRALDQCKDLFERHGGHEMAAGFTIRCDRLEELRRRMRDIARQELEPLDLRPTLFADKEIALDRNWGGVFDLLDSLEPYGMANPEALFASRNMEVMSCWQVGKDKSHLRLKLKSGNVTYDGIAFRQGYWFDKGIKKIDILYSFERNFYNDRETMQLNIRDIREAAT